MKPTKTVMERGIRLIQDINDPFHVAVHLRLHGIPKGLKHWIKRQDIVVHIYQIDHIGKQGNGTARWMRREVRWDLNNMNTLVKTLNSILDPIENVLNGLVKFLPGIAGMAFIQDVLSGDGCSTARHYRKPVRVKHCCCVLFQKVNTHIGTRQDNTDAVVLSHFNAHKFVYMGDSQPCRIKFGGIGLWPNLLRRLVGEE